MTGPELEACSVALDAFKREQTGADLANYRISVKERPNEFEIIFIPNQPPSVGSGPRRITVGGSTVYGPEVHYLIGKDGYGILKRSFAR